MFTGVQVTVLMSPWCATVCELRSASVWAVSGLEVSESLWVAFGSQGKLG